MNGEVRKQTLEAGGPIGTDGLAGVIAIETKVPLLMVSVVLPVTPEAEAEIVTVPLRLP